MSQVVAIDYGKVRCGIAATDDMQLIASALTTVETKNIFSFLEKNYSQVEPNVWIKNSLKNKPKSTPGTSNIKPIFIFDFEG